MFSSEYCFLEQKKEIWTVCCFGNLRSLIKDQNNYITHQRIFVFFQRGLANFFFLIPFREIRKMNVANDANKYHFKKVCSKITHSGKNSNA